MTAKKKMHNQKIYCYNDKELLAEQLLCMETLYDFNHTRPSEAKERAAILEKLFAKIGSDCYIEPPLHANWGKHTHLGNHVYANFNLTLVDDTHIYIGDYVMFGPNVTISTAGHPIDPGFRKKSIQFNIPVRIGNNVWIGANTVVLPGVNIGDNTVIGAGSIVTKDIPANVIAVGNPCRILRPISEHDKTFYYKDYRYEDTKL